MITDLQNQINTLQASDSSDSESDSSNADGLGFGNTFN